MTVSTGKKRSGDGFSLAASIISITFTLVFLSGPVSAPAETIIPRETEGSLTEGYVGLPVAVFEAQTSAGRTVLSGEFNGRVLVLDLWGLNCVSCLEEMKVLEEIYRDYRDKGLVVWALNTEMADARQITEGLKDRGIEISYDLLVDPDLEITKLFTNWFIPVTIIVDSNGIVQYYKVGFKDVDAEMIRAKVGVLLGE